MKKTNSKSENQTSVKFRQLHSEEFGEVKVVSDDKAEGYVCLNDLCGILNLQKKDVLPKLSAHIYTLTVKDTKGQKHSIDFVDESGLYLMFIMSEQKDVIRFQDWLFDEFLQELHEQQKVDAGLDKDAKLIIEFKPERQAMRYIATAHNVMKSGHFKIEKDVPDLTMSHLLGWWHNPNDTSTFMLQFNCKNNCYIYENIRMNVYLTKMEDGCTDECDMHISFLDLDDDNHEFFTIDTQLPSCALSDSTILDYIIESQFMFRDVFKPENVDLVVVLNGTMSFHRSRRL